MQQLLAIKYLLENPSKYFTEVYDKIISDQFDGTDISIPALKLKTREHLMSKMNHIKYTERMNKIRGFSIDY